MEVEVNMMLKLNMIREKGFTVVELLAVLAILSIIPSIRFPSLRSVIATSKEKTCRANQQLIKEGYESAISFLQSYLIRTSYMIEHDLNQCTSKGLYTLKEEKVICSKHPRDCLLYTSPSPRD